jgi:hypothetical protein
MLPVIHREVHCLLLSSPTALAISLIPEQSPFRNLVDGFIQPSLQEQHIGVGTGFLITKNNEEKAVYVLFYAVFIWVFTTKTTATFQDIAFSTGTGCAS